MLDTLTIKVFYSTCCSKSTEKYAKIEHENRLLLQKMSDIRFKGGDVATRQKVKGHSLNRERRNRELTKIMEENFALYERLQSSKPTYSRYKWEEDDRQRRKMVVNISEVSVFSSTLLAWWSSQRSARYVGPVDLC